MQKHPASMCTEPVPHLYSIRPDSRAPGQTDFGRGFGMNFREILADLNAFGGESRRLPAHARKSLAWNYQDHD